MAGAGKKKAGLIRWGLDKFFGGSDKKIGKSAKKASDAAEDTARNLERARDADRAGSTKATRDAVNEANDANEKAIAKSRELRDRHQYRTDRAENPTLAQEALRRGDRAITKTGATVAGGYGLYQGGQYAYEASGAKEIVDEKKQKLYEDWIEKPLEKFEEVVDHATGNGRTFNGLKNAFNSSAGWGLGAIAVYAFSKPLGWMTGLGQTIVKLISLGLVIEGSRRAYNAFNAVKGEEHTEDSPTNGVPTKFNPQGRGSTPENYAADIKSGLGAEFEMKSTGVPETQPAHAPQEPTPQSSLSHPTPAEPGGM